MLLDQSFPLQYLVRSLSEPLEQSIFIWSVHLHLVQLRVLLLQLVRVLLTRKLKLFLRSGWGDFYATLLLALFCRLLKLLNFVKVLFCVEVDQVGIVVLPSDFGVVNVLVALLYNYYLRKVPLCIFISQFLQPLFVHFLHELQELGLGNNATRTLAKLLPPMGQLLLKRSLLGLHVFFVGFEIKRHCVVRLLGVYLFEHQL
jgi:hypothetical protein